MRKNRAFNLLLLVCSISLLASCNTEETITTSDNQGDDSTTEHVHQFGEPIYTWSSDCSECTAVRICSKDSTHKEEETVNSTFEMIREATYEIEGIIRYTASFTDAAFSTQVKEVTIPIVIDASRYQVDATQFKNMVSIESYAKHINEKNYSIEIIKEFTVGTFGKFLTKYDNGKIEDRYYDNYDVEHPELFSYDYCTWQIYFFFEENYCCQASNYSSNTYHFYVYATIDNTNFYQNEIKYIESDYYDVNYDIVNWFYFAENTQNLYNSLTFDENSLMYGAQNIEIGSTNFEYIYFQFFDQNLVGIHQKYKDTDSDKYLLWDCSFTNYGSTSVTLPDNMTSYIEEHK